MNFAILSNFVYWSLSIMHAARTNIESQREQKKNSITFEFSIYLYMCMLLYAVCHFAFAYTISIPFGKKIVYNNCIYGAERVEQT